MIAHNTANNTDLDKKPVIVTGIDLERNGVREAVNTRGLRGEVVEEVCISAQGTDFTPGHSDYTTVSPSDAREFFGEN